jgi:hypothetical protein
MFQSIDSIENLLSSPERILAMVELIYLQGGIHQTARMSGTTDKIICDHFL